MMTQLSTLCCTLNGEMGFQEVYVIIAIAVSLTLSAIAVFDEERRNRKDKK